MSSNLKNGKTSRSVNSKKINLKQDLSSFNNFVKEFIVEGKNVEHTHTTFGPPWVKYNIPADKYNDFTTAYSKLLGQDLFITERPQEVGPLLIDLDFKFQQKNKERQYTKNDITYVIEKYNKSIKKYFSVKKKHLKAFVFEKEKPTTLKNGKYKDGIHVVYPYLPLSIGMRYKVRKDVIKDIEKEEGFENIPFINSLDDVVDKCIIENNGWMMYGSRKYDGQYYHLTKIYTFDMSEENLKNYHKRDLPALLSNRKFTSDDVLPFKESLNIIALNKDIEQVLSENGVGRKKNKIKRAEEESSYKAESESDSEDYSDTDSDSDSDDSNDSDDEKERENIKKKEKRERFDKYNDKEDGFNKAKNEYELTKKLVNIMSEERASDYNMWIRVCWALKSINKKLLETFKNFSKKSPKYDSNSCENVWNKARCEGFTIRALHRWACLDNPKEYSKLISQNVNSLIKEAESGTENDIAKVIHKLYNHSFVCSSIKHNIWYEFQDHRWVEIEAGYTLKNKISDDLTKEFALLNSSYYAEASLHNGMDKDTYLNKADKIYKIIIKLKKTSFKKSVLEECTSLFYDKTFEDKLDGNKDLVGFDNGVYDLKTKCFREGIPEDFMTFTVGYDYKEFDINNAEDAIMIAELEAYFNKAMTEKDMREYTLRLLASYLDGHIKHQKFILWTGTGSNGKSVTVSFFQKAFGEYCGVLPITVLTRKQGSASGATPEISGLRGARFVIFQEPEGDDKIYVGRMKELTGGDKIKARPMYRDPIEFIPQFKLLLTCNKLPYIPSTDGGTWRRLRVSPWESEFIDPDKNGKYNGKPLKQTQFPKDYDIGEKLERWKQVLMWYLITKYYPIYKESGLVEPEKVLQFTKKYKKDSDLFFEFLNETVVTIEDSDEAKKSFIDMKTIYDFFKEWYRESYSNNKCPNRRELKDYLEAHDYTVDKKGYVYGVKFLNDDDMDDELDD
jgi:P4 family phage/plasmid primase-like protien